MALPFNIYSIIYAIIVWKIFFIFHKFTQIVYLYFIQISYFHDSNVQINSLGTSENRQQNKNEYGNIEHFLKIISSTSAISIDIQNKSLSILK